MRELSKVKHDLEDALSEVLINSEERSRTSHTQQQEEEATSSLKQQLLDAEEQVPSSSGTEHLMAELKDEGRGWRKSLTQLSFLPDKPTRV